MIERLWVKKNKTIQVESSTIRVLQIRGGEALVEVNSQAPIGVGAISGEPISALAAHGLTEKKIDSLQAAADAGRFDGTVRGLRDWIAKSDLWYRDVKGCGASGADKITDALTKYATANPEVSSDEPLTAAEEQSSEAAAEYLGHKILSDAEADAAFEAAEPIPFKPGEVEAIARKIANEKPKAVASESSAGKPIGDYHETNKVGLAKTEAMMRGESNEAYLAGLAAGASDVSCSMNPYEPRGSAAWNEWIRGWEAGCPK